MPTSVTCSQCGKRVAVPDKLAGRSLRCPKCKAILPTGGPPTPQRPSSTRSGTAPAPRRDGLIKFGGTMALFGLIALVAPFFGLQLRKAQNLGAGGQQAVGVSLLVIGGLCVLFGFLPAVPRKTKRLVLIGAGSVVALLVLGFVALIVLAARSDRAGPASPPPAYAQPGQPMRTMPAAPGAPAMPTPPMPTPPMPSGPPSRDVAIVDAPPTWAMQPNTARIDLLNARPADADAIRAALERSRFSDPTMLGPTASGTCQIWVRNPYFVVLNTQQLGAIRPGQGQVVTIAWGEPVSRPPPSSRPRGPRPPPTWANASDAAKIVLSGVTRDDRDAFNEALRRSNFEGYQSSFDEAAGEWTIYVRATPDEAASMQKFGTVTSRDGKEIRVEWSPP